MREELQTLKDTVEILVEKIASLESVIMKQGVTIMNQGAIITDLKEEVANLTKENKYYDNDEGLRVLFTITIWVFVFYRCY